MRNAAPGNCSSSAYQPLSGESIASCANSVSPANTRARAELPKIDTTMKSQRTGAVIAASTNSRSVRPREMRARKSPTNGPQASQNAQKKSVQQERGLAGHQDVDHHHGRAPEVELGDDADALVDAGRARGDRHDDRDDDKRDLQAQTLRESEEPGESHIQQDDADPHRRRDAEHDAHERDDVDDVAGRAPHAHAQQ